MCAVVTENSSSAVKTVSVIAEEGSSEEFTAIRLLAIRGQILHQGMAFDALSHVFVH